MCLVSCHINEQQTTVQLLCLSGLVHHFFVRLPGVLNNEGPDWKILRRTTISSLRDFGLGKATIESAILDEADVLAKLLDKQVDSPVDMAPLFGFSTLNIICHIAFRTRYESECCVL